MTIHTPGELIAGRYLIEEFIGEGGMQEVYRVSDSILSRHVALKTPKTASAVKRFLRSAQTAAKINHANVAKTIDYIETDGRAYLIEELVDGLNLGHFLRHYVSRLDPYACAQSLHHLAKGLAASHRAGVVHRDIKPTNVVVDGGAAFKDLKITDFGIAKMAEAELEKAVEGGDPDALTSSATALGALPYMSPEMIDSFATADKPTDVWSLGAMTFELLTGTKPFGADWKAVSRIEAGKVPPLPVTMTRNVQFSALTQEIYAICQACMTKDVLSRPDADAVVQMCEQLCYSEVDREFGTISNFQYTHSGFIARDDGGSAFFHNDSSPSGPLSVGDRVWFSRHPGTPYPRAFPVVRAQPIPAQ